ncbi:ribonuclease E inhibitor RraB [Thalassococcus sp. CAU 1522]|uniref:Ribonuclease E inhibitor RraB n=1 Tax=Thalassococcus arenae TaxID=2851652 RepID=A0ABS6N6X5_9RHOB|nr:ribonuclease E inhibitor RraB [Thalassococcus arenae]
MSNHDFAAQRAATIETYRALSEDGLPDIADVDYFFVPESDAANWDAAVAALHDEGYDCSEVEDEDGVYLAATLQDHVISAEGIWFGEEVATRIALRHGFTPDGWGFEG